MRSCHCLDGREGYERAHAIRSHSRGPRWSNATTDRHANERDEEIAKYFDLRVSVSVEASTQGEGVKQPTDVDILRATLAVTYVVQKPLYYLVCIVPKK